MSDSLLHAGIFLATFLGMEGVAWATHKYLMHGWLWVLHESHHRERRGRFELNDLFGVFFAAISIVLIYLGVNGTPALLFVGLGMTAYGFMYFMVHDVLVHHRIAHVFVPRSGYLRRIYQAHRLHHSLEERDGAVSFGFLYAPRPEKLATQLKAGLDA